MRPLFILLVIALSAPWGGPIIAQADSLPFYPSNSEILGHLMALEVAHPEIVKYRELGRATHSDLPIMALKISDNVQETEDEPVWIFTGVIHGNEQIGVRILLDLATELTNGYGMDSSMTNWVDAYEIWLVLSMNPWGYAHGRDGNPRVSGTRKNYISTSDPNSSGVDLNRNFDMNWNTSDSHDPMSYQYKGASAFSENESQAFRDLVLERKPLFGICYHQGLNEDGGLVFYPAGANGKVLKRLASSYANWVFDSRQNGPFCTKDTSDKYLLLDPYSERILCRRPVTKVAQAAGYSTAWSYAAAGTADLMVEVSRYLYNEEFMHVNSDSLTGFQEQIFETAREFSRNHQEGIKSWFRQFLYSSDPRQFLGPGITGHVRDAHTGEPLLAVIEIKGSTFHFLADRSSEPIFGRFWRLLPAEEHIVTISAPGYLPWRDTLTLLDDAPLLELEIALTPGAVAIDPMSAELTSEYDLSPAFPNPSQSQTKFYLTVRGSQRVEIIVCDLQGKIISSFQKDILSTGVPNEIILETGHWEGGLYLVRIRGAYFQDVKMVTVINQ